MTHYSKMFQMMCNWIFYRHFIIISWWLLVKTYNFQQVSRSLPLHKQELCPCNFYKLHSNWTAFLYHSLSPSLLPNAGKMFLYVKAKQYLHSNLYSVKPFLSAWCKYPEQHCGYLLFMMYSSSRQAKPALRSKRDKTWQDSHFDLLETVVL